MGPFGTTLTPAHRKPAYAAMPSPVKATAERIEWPLPPIAVTGNEFEMEIFSRFMHYAREMPNHRPEIKIFSAIGFTADTMDIAEALVAKTLIDLGLRAPRHAFPTSFLDFTDRTAQRTAWDRGTPPKSVAALQEHWQAIGEGRFAHIGMGRMMTDSALATA